MSQYRVIEKIGEGGMGVVYKADDTVLRRPVVLKFLPPEHQTSQERIDRFLREARSASTLNHPNIVTMHNVVQEDSMICLVLEFVDGSALDEITSRTGLPVDEVLAYAVQITDALAAAHEAGIVHRDIKPGNVMVLPSGTIKVLDFGLAKLDPLATVDSEGRTETLLTQAGRVVGTPAYMSPEQVLGSAVDTRSDIFSCGAMLYELLTGSLPFQATESNSVLHAIVQEQEVPVTDLREDLPPALGAVLAKSVDGPSARRNRWVALAAAFGVFALAIWLWPGTREALRGWAGSEGDERGAEIEPPATVEPETAFEFVQRGNGLLDHYYRTGYVDQAVASF
ncbi:MAG: protein kinase [Thermoanaerobaculia bacterium]